MPTSLDTSKQIVRILAKYLPKEKLVELLDELHKVEGNKSFRDSINRILWMANAIRPKEPTKPQFPADRTGKHGYTK